MKSLSKQQIETLIRAAKNVRSKAYAPYSHFFVGCALLCDDGSIVTGANVENVSYGLTICAERSAVVKAVSDERRQFVGAAIATASTPPGFPCGACRQVLAEFAPSLPIYLVNEQDDMIETSLDKIFPSNFSVEDLNSGAARA